MIEQGLKVSSEKEALATLTEIDRDSPNGTETLQQFIAREEQNPKFVEIGAKVYYGNSENISVKAVPGAPEILAKFHKHHDLVLVSTGVEEEQYRKMKSAHLNPSWFSSICIVPRYDKKKIYQQLLSQKKYLPSQSVVCGDKFDIDLAPATELGMKTVHFLNGRGARFLPKTGSADYSIKSLAELIPIIDTLS